MILLRTLTLKGKLFAGAALLLFVIAVCAGLYFSGKRDGKAQQRANTAEAGQKAALEARQADSVAQAAVGVENEAVAQENQRAREAAAKSPDDPLKAGLDALRK